MNDSTLDIKAFLDKDEQKDLLRLLTGRTGTRQQAHGKCRRPH